MTEFGKTAATTVRVPLGSSWTTSSKGRRMREMVGEGGVREEGRENIIMFSDLHLQTILTLLQINEN